MRKGIHWDMCEWIKFDHDNKPESVHKISVHKILWDFNIQTDHPKLARRSGLILINKERTYKLEDLAIPVDHKVNIKESEKTGKY